MTIKLKELTRQQAITINTALEYFSRNWEAENFPLKTEELEDLEYLMNQLDEQLDQD